MLTAEIKSNTGAFQVQTLLKLAIEGLSPMFYPEKSLFCYRLRKDGDAMVREGVSHRYTIISLLGLGRAVAAGFVSPVDRSALRAALCADLRWLDNLGDLGLYAWETAIDAPDSLTHFVKQFALDRALEHYPCVQERRTMELAWFLSGLAHIRLADAAPDLKDVAMQAFRLLKQNQGPGGLFGHQGARGVVGTIRGHIGSFADQVYPIYALSKFGQAYGLPEALADATACADAICALQGPLGQWWWHYQTATTQVVEAYPVYAVHQDAMAPMALFALSAATGRDMSGPVRKGLHWISGTNELNRDLRDFEKNLVWRSLYHGKSRMIANTVRTTCKLSPSTAGLKINYEDRPYHLGWLLYAFAGR